MGSSLAQLLCRPSVVSANLSDELTDAGHHGDQGSQLSKTVPIQFYQVLLSDHLFYKYWLGTSCVPHIGWCGGHQIIFYATRNSAVIAVFIPLLEDSKCVAVVVDTPVVLTQLAHFCNRFCHTVSSVPSSSNQSPGNHFMILFL